MIDENTRTTEKLSSGLTVASLDLIKTSLTNLGGFVIGKRTLGKGTDSLNNEINRINEGLVYDFGTSAGVLTKRDNEKLQAKIDATKPASPAIQTTDEQYVEAAMARVRLVNLYKLNHQQQIEDTIKEYGFDPSKPDLSEEEQKKLKEKSLRGQMTSELLHLHQKSQHPLDENNSAMLGRVFSFALTCGGFEALELISNFIDCFVGNDFETGVKNVMSGPNVVGPSAKIADASEMDVVAAKLSSYIPVISDINGSAVMALNTDAGLIAVEGFQSIATSDVARYGLIAGALAYQVIKELSVNSEFNKSIKEIRDEVNKFREVIKEDVDKYYRQAADKLAEKKEFDLALKELELKKFIEDYRSIDHYYPSGANPSSAESFKSKFSGIQITDSEGNPLSVIDYIRHGLNSQDSPQKTISDVVEALSHDPKKLADFMEVASNTLSEVQKNAAKKELMTKIINGGDKKLTDFDCLKDFLPDDPLVNPTIDNVFNRIVSSSRIDNVLKKLAVESKSDEIYRDIKDGNGFFEKIDPHQMRHQAHSGDNVGAEPIPLAPPPPPGATSPAADPLPHSADGGEIKLAATGIPSSAPTSRRSRSFDYARVDRLSPRSLSPAPADPDLGRGRSPSLDDPAAGVRGIRPGLPRFIRSPSPHDRSPSLPGRCGL